MMPTWTDNRGNGAALNKLMTMRYPRNGGAHGAGSTHEGQGTEGPSKLDPAIRQSGSRRPCEREHRELLASTASRSCSWRADVAYSSRGFALGQRGRGDVRAGEEERSTTDQRTQAEEKACVRTKEVCRPLVTTSTLMDEKPFRYDRFFVAVQFCLSSSSLFATLLLSFLSLYSHHSPPLLLSGDWYLWLVALYLPLTFAVGCIGLSHRGVRKRCGVLQGQAFYTCVGVSEAGVVSGAVQNQPGSNIPSLSPPAGVTVSVQSNCRVAEPQNSA